MARRRLRDKRLDARKEVKAWTPRHALEQVDRERWQCLTCDSPALEDCKYCLSCKLYWEDIRDGRIAGCRFR